jgi:hypothetical protein
MESANCMQHRSCIATPLGKFEFEFKKRRALKCISLSAVVMLDSLPIQSYQFFTDLIWFDSPFNELLTYQKPGFKEMGITHWQFKLAGLTACL